jgi:putative salt-induced outer membrane protein YdiY
LSSEVGRILLAVLGAVNTFIKTFLFISFLLPAMCWQCAGNAHFSNNMLAFQSHRATSIQRKKAYGAPMTDERFARHTRSD